MGIWSTRKKYTIANKDEAPINIKTAGIIRKQMAFMFVSVFSVTLVILGSAYAVFSSINKSSTYNTVQVGTLQIAYDDTSSGLGNIIQLNNAFPITDAQGEAQTGYKFSIKNTGTLPTTYSVRIVDDQAMIDADGCQSNLLDKGSVKYSVNGAAPVLLSSVEGTTPTWKIATGTLNANATQVYEIKIWIKSDAGNDVLGKHFHGKVVIEGLQ